MKFLNKLRYAICNLDYKWKVFCLATFVSFIGILMIFISASKDMGINITAAYIFYIAIELIPSTIRDREDLPAKAIAYRRLQLLLHRFDSIFVNAYELACGTKVSALSVESFYDPISLRAFMTGFDLEQIVDVESYTGKKYSFKEYAITQWNDALYYAKALLQMQCIQDDANLMYLIHCLFYEGSLPKVIELLGSSQLTIGFENVLLPITSGGLHDNTLDTIIKLHKKALLYYGKLKKHKACRSIVHAPSFFLK